MKDHEETSTTNQTFPRKYTLFPEGLKRTRPQLSSNGSLELEMCFFSYIRDSVPSSWDAKTLMVPRSSIPQMSSVLSVEETELQIL